MRNLTINWHDFAYLAPEIVLTVWGLLVLTIDFSLFRRRPGAWRCRALGLLALIGVAGALASVFLPRWIGVETSSSTPDLTLFYGTIAADNLTRWLNVLLLVLLGMVVGISMTWSFTEHWGEYFVLLLWATVGMMLLIASEEFLTLFLTLEMMTICLYLTTAFEKSRRRSAEGGLKYFVYGSVSSALLLFGLSLIYGLTGTTRFAAIGLALRPGAGHAEGLANNVAGAMALLLMMVGFGFKVAAVPFHQWAPDAYEGAPAPVTAWIATGSKVASFIALMKVLYEALGAWADVAQRPGSPGWVGVVALVAAASMTFGNFAALAQRNLKRMLAYSSIAHAGYILVGVLAAAVSLDQGSAIASVLYYLVVYAFTTVGAFAAAAWLVRDRARDDIDDLNGLGFQSPALAVCIVLLMLSLIGMPPLAGFFGKLYMFMEALNVAGNDRVTLLWLVALGLLNSVVSAFYYVRVLKAMFLRRPERGSARPAPLGVSVPIVLATAVVVGLGLASSPALDLMNEAGLPLVSSNSLTLANKGRYFHLRPPTGPLPKLPTELFHHDPAEKKETPPEPEDGGITPPAPMPAPAPTSTR